MFQESGECLSRGYEPSSHAVSLADSATLLQPMELDLFLQRDEQPAVV